MTHLLAEDVGLLPGEVTGLAVLAAPAPAVPFDRGFRVAAPAAPAAAVGLAAVGLAAAGALVVPAAVDLAVVEDAGLDVAPPAGRVAGGFEVAVELREIDQ